MSCTLACYDRQKTASKVNQQPANHTESDERLVSKEISVSRRWETETPKFGIKRVDEGQISTVKR